MAMYNILCFIAVEVFPIYYAHIDGLKGDFCISVNITKMSLGHRASMW